MYPNMIDCLKRVRRLVCSNAVPPPPVTEADIYILYSGGLTFHGFVPLAHKSGFNEYSWNQGLYVFWPRNYVEEEDGKVSIK